MPADAKPPLPAFLPAHVRRAWFALCDRLRAPVRIVEEHPGIRAVEVLGVLRYLFLPTARRVHFSYAVGGGRFVAGPTGTFVNLHPPLATDHWLALFVANWLVAREGARVPPDRFDEFYLSVRASRAFRELADRARACHVVAPLRAAIAKGLALDPEVLAFLAVGWHAKPLLDTRSYSEAWMHLGGYRQILREAPQLAHLFAFAAAGRHVGVHGEPAKTLKAAVRRAGLGNTGWRQLLTTDPADFDAVLEHVDNDDPFLACLWAVKARLLARHPLPREVLARLAAPQGVYNLDPPVLQPFGLLQGIWPTLLPALGKRLSSVGTGSALEHFLDGEFEDVMLMLRSEAPEFDANQARAGWPLLLRLQREWAERYRQAAIARAEPFPPGLHPNTASHGPFRLVALDDSFALWEDGWHMGHCIHDYREESLAGRFVAFSIRDAEGRRLATGAMARDEDSGWELFQVRGRLNRPVSAELEAVAEWFVDIVRALDEREEESTSVDAERDPMEGRKAA